MWQVRVSPWSRGSPRAPQARRREPARATDDIVAQPTSSPVVTASGATSTTTTPVPGASTTTASPVPKPTAKPFDVDTVLGGIRALAAIGPRDAASPAYAQAADWVGGQPGGGLPRAQAALRLAGRGVLGRTRASRATRQRHRRSARLRPSEAARRHRRAPRHRAPVARGRGQRVGHHGHGGSWPG